jgi:hypothetical protein
MVDVSAVACGVLLVAVVLVMGVMLVLSSRGSTVLNVVLVTGGLVLCVRHGGVLTMTNARGRLWLVGSV